MQVISTIYDHWKEEEIRSIEEITGHSLIYHETLAGISSKFYDPPLENIAGPRMNLYIDRQFGHR